MTDMTVPILTYEQIEADLASRRLVARDLLGSDRHYDRWRRRNGLKSSDGTPQELYKRYEEDPRGAETCPPHADLWQFLIKASRSIPWQEAPGHRVKNVPICSTMFAEPQDFSDETVAKGRLVLEASAGEKMPDHVWRTFERSIRKEPAADRRCIQEIADLLDRHGLEHAAFGRMMLVTLRVDC